MASGKSTSRKSETIQKAVVELAESGQKNKLLQLELEETEENQGITQPIQLTPKT